jgi:antitoxin component YwqK of YwqJK toxin-antitoxin module
MKLCVIILLTTFASSLPLFGEADPTPTPGETASPATPASLPAEAPAAANTAPVQLYSLDYNEDLDLFYASGTQTAYTGAVYSNYENGKKELVGALKDGQRDGHWTEYYEDGKIASIGDYRGGKEVGPWKYWFENGTLQSEGSYSDASPVGKWTTYYDNGKPESEGIYVAGEMDGPWKLYDDSTGEVRTVKFKDGEQLP